MSVARSSLAWVATGPRQFEMRRYPVLDPAGDGAVIKVEACGICGTDVHIYMGQTSGKSPFPLILGHEVAGTITAVGKNFGGVDSVGAPVGEGDRIFVAPGVSCGFCYKCSVLEVPTRCLNKKAYGFTPNPDQWPHLTGGYAEYMHVFIPHSLFFKTTVPAEVATLIEPYSIALHGLDKAQIQPGDTVAVQGSGAIGLLTLVGAKKCGASKVIVLGAPEGRLKLAKQLGADLVVDITRVPLPERVEMVRKETPAGLGADVVLECAGQPAAVAEGLELLRDGGRFVELGNFTDNGETSLNPFRHMVSKNNAIYGVWGALPKHLVRALWLIEQDPATYRTIVSHTVPLAQVGEIFEALSEQYSFNGQDVIKAVVVPTSD